MSCTTVGGSATTHDSAPHGVVCKSYLDTTHSVIPAIGFQLSAAGRRVGDRLLQHRLHFCKHARTGVLTDRMPSVGAGYAVCGARKLFVRGTGGQYWRLENLKSFDEFLERRSPESGRKAYYLMSIHKKPAAAGEEGPERSGLDEGIGAGEGGARGGSGVRLCNLVAQGSRNAEGRVQAGSIEGTSGTGLRTGRDHVSRSTRARFRSSSRSWKPQA